MAGGIAGLPGGADLGEEFDSTALQRGQNGHIYGSRLGEMLDAKLDAEEALAAAKKAGNIVPLVVDDPRNQYGRGPDVRSNSEKTWARFADHMGRNKIRYIVGTIVGIVIGVGSYLTWYFVAGPGKTAKFNPVDKPVNNQPRLPQAVEVDVITGSVNAAGTTPVLVDADMQGVYTQTGVGTWKVNSNSKVEFTPDKAYDFNTPATAKYRLNLAGVDSDDTATITITYVAAGMTDPTLAENTLTANYKDTVTFDTKNATGKLVLVNPDANSASTQTTKDVGVWTLTDSSHITFKADSAFKGIRVETSVKLDLGNSKFSDPVTLTVMFNQPKAADRFIQGFQPGQLADRINVAMSAEAKTPNKIVEDSVKLVGLQDLELGSTPSNVITVDGKELSADGEGIWMVGDKGTISFVPATQKAATSFTPGIDRNNFSGQVGFRFQSAKKQKVTSLGIRKGTANTGNWAVSLLDTSMSVLATVQIDLGDSSKVVGQYYYGSVDCVLAGGIEYYLVTDVSDTSGIQPPAQLWAEVGPISLDSKVASAANAIYRDTGYPAFTIKMDGPGKTYVGLDFTVVEFETSPTPVVYTISDDQGNTSNEALVVLNYGATVTNSDLNSEKDDTKFFAKVKQEAIDHQPPLDLVVLLATLEFVADITATMLKSAELGMSPISESDFAARYTAFKGAPTPSGLWNSCLDIDKKKVDPAGAKSSFYARYWRMRTMVRLLKQLVVELDLT
ncbi:MAG: hypothetical protein NTW74_19955 [Acidobacteria bacterium]|nr:hypothetical protein [Acidobacteriota bacterium]